ncbi:uncharacterized protein MELLADRAFT_105011 [Melampsora larici-populina 98AG31]|uniref:Secreted protein n=1 Tax=Melampsora larici-populina (strain 98AG31 / pathotype 3-4-7) TaxID=747676 RepID=F4RGN2_MELLP|nr:uncharacterized protein MELLADRAFT_105011 [Melampsora larici-populina 98AG31]EGG08595.1 hypothetical protein MELLADRAFT_105011 [Melampsora larici-populina 98AG31]
MFTSTLVTFIMMLSVIAEKPKPNAQPICVNLFNKSTPPTSKSTVPTGHKLSVNSVDSTAQRRSLDLEEDGTELETSVNPNNVLAVKGGGEQQKGKTPATKLRFKTTAPVDWLKSDNSPCGPYKTEAVMGACLWQGKDPSGADASKAGWLSGAATKMCGQELSVARAGKPNDIITVKVIDACSFNIKMEKAGCNQIYLSKKAFDALKPTAVEAEKGSMSDLIWDIKAPATGKATH